MAGPGGVGVGTLVVAPVAVVGLLVGFVVLIGGEDAAASECGPGASITIDPATIPTEPIAGFAGEQLLNAAYIAQAGSDLGLSSRDQTIGIMTAIGESSLQVLDYGDAAGPDSRGLFQQRDSWGSLADRMDPYRSATLFFERLAALEDRDSLTPTIAAHRIQINADPFHYERYWDPAVAILNGLSGVDTGQAQGAGNQVCTGQGGSVGEVNEEGWAVVDDGPITSGYGWRVDPLTGSFSKFHYGTDLAAGCGAPIYTANEGVVIRAGMHIDTSGAGWIEIDHGSGIITRYVHMEADGIYVEAGDRVAPGEQIGAEGSTGRSTGCHLHFEVLVNGQNVNPADFMAAQGIQLG